MKNYSQYMLAVTVFAFMMTAVNLVPTVLPALQEAFKKRFKNTSRELDKFFVHMNILHIVSAAAGLGLLVGWLAGSWVVGVAIIVLGISAPKIGLLIYTGMRTEQFEAQLMDALILINNALRSGLDIATGFELVANDMKPPISEEFGVVINTYRLGGSLENALLDMTKRIPSRPLETAVGAIVIQRETGGNLIKTFDQLVQTIREESKLEKKVRAISSQGRMQISFLAIFPWCLALLFYFMSPDMMQPALADTRGQLVVIGLFVWEAIGYVVTKRVIAVEV